ncbi:hypothetical protein [Actinacidiphila soli]|uniref:hypothetical protein n=1 Tax=Actinacidiphila soli TaxID=2487275 RepID=UPI001F0BFBB9|nr:hypothetical protein [Actinacidiphila soli]
MAVIVAILLVVLVAKCVRGLSTAARVRRASSPPRTSSGNLVQEETEKLLGRTAIRAAYAPVLEEARDFAVQRHPGLTVIAEMADGSPADVLRARAPGTG